MRGYRNQIFFNPVFRKRSLLLMLFLASFCYILQSQEKVPILDANGLSLDTIRYFTEESLQSFGIPLDQRLGWIYKEGHNMAWSQNTIDLEGWKRVIPNNIDTSFADKNGRIEGWFRFKFSIDTGLSKVPLFLFKTQHFAAEVYLDGELFESYGETGTDKDDFQEYISDNPLYQLPIYLEPDQVHTLAIHYVDYTISSNGYMKQEALPFWPPFFYLANNGLFEMQRNTKETFATKITGAILFFILFWSLYLVNRNKDILICSLFVSFLLYQMILWAVAGLDGTTVYFSFRTLLILQSIHLINATIFPALLVLIASKLLLNRIGVLVKVFVVTLSLFAIVCSVIYYNPGFDVFSLGFSIFNVSSVLAQASGFVMLTWLLWSNRKTITGPKKVLVWGYILLITISIIVTCLLIFRYLNSYRAIVESFGLAGFPLLVSFAIYIALQLNEYSKQVLKIEGEKRQILSDQNATLEKQVQERTSSLNKSLDDLKATQAQLIQSEKMASLGELTAGIAHEIQNPLNFVNNFSDVSGELIDEAIVELTSEDIISASFDSAQDRPLSELQLGRLNEVKDILKDLKGNLEKISHHGGRASSIVRGMLDHSRASSGEKKPTDINALCDEYLRLSYHGLRAKDKSFNASFETNFDESLPKINVVSQDMGRVLLNIVNNAFFACAERGRRTVTSAPLSDHQNFKPKVTISTRRLSVAEASGIEIRIQDNGIGMSQETIDKVFQPFFTTKPTGQGTGLGMSISYDIVTKGHGGELKVESEEGEGSEFIIHLPIV